MVFKPFGLNPASLYWVIAAVVVPMLLVVGFLLQVAHRAAHLEYRLDDGGLTVHWGRPFVVPYDEIEEVHYVPGRPKLRRLVGTAVGSINVGRFHLADVGTLMLYGGRTRDHLVVVETENRGRLGLTPDDPERFVAELSRRTGIPRGGTP